MNLLLLSSLFLVTSSKSHEDRQIVPNATHYLQLESKCLNHANFFTKHTGNTPDSDQSTSAFCEVDLGKSISCLENFLQKFKLDELQQSLMHSLIEEAQARKAHYCSEFGRKQLQVQQACSRDVRLIGGLVDCGAMYFDMINATVASRADVSENQLIDLLCIAGKASRGCVQKRRTHFCPDEVKDYDYVNQFITKQFSELSINHFLGLVSDYKIRSCPVNLDPLSIILNLPKPHRNRFLDAWADIASLPLHQHDSIVKKKYRFPFLPAHAQLLMWLAPLESLNITGPLPVKGKNV